MRRAIFFAAWVISGIYSSISFGATYGGGSGTAADPYQIWTAEQMNTIGANSGDWGKSFKLMTDIDMSAYTGTQYNIIGNSSVKFTGTFDGNGHIISNLTYTKTASTNYIGLFGYTSAATIKNLGVSNISLSVSNSSYVGGLVGYNGGLITTCYVTGSIQGNGTIGGLVGFNGSSITSSYAIANVSGYDYIGGLIGTCFGSISACYATGSVSGQGNNIGGLLGNIGIDNSAASCFWDINTSGQAGSFGGKGLTITQMKTMSIYQNADWAGKGWVIQDGVGYPRLSWEGSSGTAIPTSVNPFVGSGTSADPYLITTPTEFAALSWYSDILNKQIKLTTNLDLSGITLSPIGVLGGFTGVFDGNGHTITNATIDKQSDSLVGLFGEIGNNGQIKNVGLVNVNIHGRMYVGGLAGQSYNGKITSCFAIGQITGYKVVGGLLGYAYGGTIASCYTMGTASGEYCGGLAGSLTASGKITACYSNSYISNAIEGGLVGSVGYSGCTLTACFWDTQTSGQSGTERGGKGLTTAQMKTLSVFQNADWIDKGWVIQDGVDYPRLSWEGTGGTAIPAAVIPFAGSGTLSNPYLISTAQDFAALSWYSGILNKQIKLMADLDLNGVLLYPIGDLGQFTGVFDGNGCTLRNAEVYLPDSSCIGLFGSIGSGGQVKNLGIMNIDVCGKETIGGLAGSNYYGTLSGCCVNGSIHGGTQYSNFIGGLVGENYRGSLANCYVAGSIIGDWYLGGIAGDDQTGIIRNCYSTALVNSTDLSPAYIGGLIGKGTSDSVITGCFWDTQTSGRTTNYYGGTGKTTAEMQTLSTFTSAGWDFAGETANGTADIWTMFPNSYPILSWQQKGSLQVTFSPQGAINDGAQWRRFGTTAWFNSGDIENNVPCGAWAIEFKNISGWSVPTTTVMIYVNQLTQVNAIYIQSVNISIGTGTSSWNYPLETYYHDARTQTIYLAGEIGGACKITSLALDVTTIPGQVMNNFTIRFKYTDLSIYGTGPVWESTGWTTVYQANQTVSATGLNTFTFSTPFEYNGTQNLMVDISFNNSSYTTSGQCKYTSLGTYRSISHRTDSGYGDPLTWTSTTPTPGRSTNFPNLVLGIAMSLPTVETPVFAPDGGCYTTGQNVTVTCATTSAVIHYTTNGADPTEADPVMINGGTVAVSVNPATTLRARAFAIDMNPSEIKSATYRHPYGGGSGTQADPYQIWTAQQMNTIGTIPEHWDKYFKLVADIDLSVYTGTQYNIIGSEDEEFSGTFDGNNHLIENFTYITTDAEYGVGLFGYTSGILKNLKLVNAAVASGGRYIGSLAGYQCSGKILHCSSSVSITSGGTIGGLVGTQGGGLILNCSSTGSIRGVGGLGGIAGISGGVIEDCFSSCVICGSGTYEDNLVGIGGLVGTNYGIINNCWSLSDVSAMTDEGIGIGGLVGEAQGVAGEAYSGHINNSYSIGRVVVKGNITGGLVGYLASNVTNCYSSCNVAGDAITGGLVGKNNSYGNVITSFWDTQTSGQTASDGGTGKTTVEMKTLSAFTSVGWDFTNETANGTDDIWRMCVDGMNYPKLNWESTTGDFACPDGVNAEDLSVLSACWMETVEAKADMDADGSVNLNDYIKLAQQWMITGCDTCGGADITGDGNVDEADLDLLVGQWLLEENTACKMADLNNNGKVDLADLAVFAQHWLQL